MDRDLAKRLFQFSVSVIKFLRTLLGNAENRVIKYQLTKSSTSSGANFEEAQAGSSKADFHNKIMIALKEMRESNYWLRLLKATEDKLNENQIKELDRLVQESKELGRILGAIGARTKVN